MLVARESNGCMDTELPGMLPGTLAGTALLLVGVLLLRMSWVRRGAHNALPMLGGWLILLAAAATFGWAWGGELGTIYAFLAWSAVAYAVVGVGVELRAPKRAAARALALEPESRPANWTRGIVKSFLAIVFAGIAAVGIGVAFAVAMPLEPKDRIIIGGLLVPVLWGGGMAWTLSDAKLLRATLLLIVISIAAYGIAFLPKLMSA
jgi:hypothetical protein